MYFQTFSEVCTHYFQCFGECAHPFHGHFLRVRRFFRLLLKCALLSSPASPNSGVRVPGAGWRFLLLEGSHTHSTNVFTKYWRSRAAWRAD